MLVKIPTSSCPYQRRTVPTVGELALFDTLQMMSLGDWQGAATSRADVRHAEKEMKMPLRYSASKNHTALLSKLQVVEIVRALARSEETWNKSWEQLQPLFPPQEDARAAAEQAFESTSLHERRAQAQPGMVATIVAKGGLSTASSTGVKLVRAAAEHLTATAVAMPGGGRVSCPMPEEASSAGEGSSSSSSGSSASEELSDNVSESEVERVQWLLSAGKRGHIHLMGEGRDKSGRWLTQCSRKLHNPQMGVGLAEAESTAMPWSPRCKAKLPAAAGR